MVQAEMWGQHGDHLVPIWSQIRVRGIDPDRLSEAVAGFRAGRSLADLPHEIQEAKGRMLALVREGRIAEARQAVQSLPPDLRAAVTPFFTHFTAGRTTEMATAHSVVDILAALARGQRQVVPAQVDVGADWPGLSGVLGVPVTLDPTGWSRVVRTDVAADEWQALHGAVAAVSSGSAEQPPHTATVDG
jgi:malate dehydrogenase